MLLPLGAKNVQVTFKDSYDPCLCVSNKQNGACINTMVLKKFCPKKLNFCSKLLLLFQWFVMLKKCFVNSIIQSQAVTDVYVQIKIDSHK